MSYLRTIVLSILVTLGGSGYLTGQLAENIWYLGGGDRGSRAGIRFGADGTISDYSSVRAPLNLSENNIMVTDPATGEVLLYSDGSQVIDRSNQVMPRGRNLRGTPSNMYGTAVILDPDNCDRYMIIYGENVEARPPRGVFYSRIDLALPGTGTLEEPNGEVLPLDRNRRLTDSTINVSESLYALPKNDGSRESWLFIGDRNTSSLLLYEVTAEGIALRRTLNLAEVFGNDYNPFVELFGLRIEFQPGTLEEGILAIVPVTNLINEKVPIGYLPFNRVTGNFRDTKATVMTDAEATWTYGLAFSPDGKLLYFSDYFKKTLRQHEFATSRTRLLATSPHNGRTGGLKVGPDQRLYWVNSFFNFGGNSVNSIARLDNPNAIGAASGLQYDAVRFNGDNQLVGALPRFGAFPTPPEAIPLSSVSCISPVGSATVIPGAGIAPFNYVWEDGTREATNNNLAAGRHFVTVTDASGCERVASVDIAFADVDSTPPLINPNDGLCEGETAMLYPITPIAPAANTFWAAPNGTIYPGDTLQVANLTSSAHGLYTFTVDVPGCANVVAEYELFSGSFPTVLASDTTTCEEQLDLAYLSGEDEISWRHGLAQGSDTVRRSGVYRYTRTSPTGCSLVDSISVTMLPAPVVELPKALVAAECQSITIRPLTNFAPNTFRYSWASSPAILPCEDCDAVSLIPLENSVVSLQVLDSRTGCFGMDSTVVSVEANRKVYFPNAFSPNGDGVNDRFLIGVKNPQTVISSYRIYDRWGAMLFESAGLPAGDQAYSWDGKKRDGRLFDPAVFIYKVDLLFADGTTSTHSGNVMLVK